MTKNEYWKPGMLSPILCFLILIFLGPFLYMVWLSLTDLSFASAPRNGNFIGLANYLRALFSDRIFLDSIAQSALFSALCVLPQIVIGVALSEFLHNSRSMQQILSPLLALPALMPSVIVGLYWRILLQGEFGLVSYYASKAGFQSAKGILSSPKLILFTLSAVDFWQWGPFVALVLLAARSTQRKAPLEAAWLDGASPIRAFFDVTLPGLFPAVFVIGTIRAIDSFKEFDKVFILTGGGPGTASELTSIYVWRQAFRNWEFGYGAALCVLIYLLIYAVTQLGFKWSRLGDQR
jgi:multiple sugar transport system permease protein